MSAPETNAPDAPTPPGTPAATTPRRRRWPLVVVGLLLAGGAFFALLPTLLSTGWTRALIQSWLDENVDRKVSFSSLDVSWTGGVTLRDLVVSDQNDQDLNVLTAPEIRLDAPLFPLLLKKLDVRKLTIDDAVVHVAMRKDGVNTEGVMKRRKSRKPHKEKGPEEGGGGSTEPMVLPEISVPMEVRRLTLEFETQDGRTVRQKDIEFSGHLATRNVPTTFDLHVPTGAGDGLRFRGEAVLFDPNGELLAETARRVDAELIVDRLSAAEHGDLIKLFMPDVPLAGVVDGKFVVHTLGKTAQGTVAMRLLDVHVGEKGAAAASGREDLSITGSFESGPDSFALRDFAARAEGVEAHANVSGSWTALTGEGRFDADLERLVRALRGLGIEIKGELAGKLTGSVDFKGGDGATGKGVLALTAFRAAKFVPDAPPVTVDDARVTFTVEPSAQVFRLKQLEARLPDLTAKATGERHADGALRLDASVDGDLGGLLQRIRDLGLLPGGFSVNGRLKGDVVVAGGKDGAGYAVSTPGMVLAEDDVKLTLTGGMAADGSIDAAIKGGGDLGRLLRRAQDAGAGPAAMREVDGRFDVDLRATGTRERTAVTWNMGVDGALKARLTGALSPDKALSGRLEAQGAVAELETLLLRTAMLDRPFGLTGDLTAEATLAGTADEPLVPSLSMSVANGPVKAKLTGALRAGREINGSVEVSGELDDVTRIARTAGFLEKDVAPGGSFTMSAVAKGKLDAIDVQRARVQVHGPLEADLDGSMDSLGVVSATATAKGDLAPLLRLWAQWEGREDATQGAAIGGFDVRATISGQRDALAARIDKAELARGKFTFGATGTRDAAGLVTSQLSAAGDVGDALALVHDVQRALGREVSPWNGSGVMELRTDIRMEGDVVSGNASGTADLTLAKAGEDGAPIHESGLTFTLERLRYDRATERLDPLALHLGLRGASIDGEVTLTPPPAADKDAPPPPPDAVPPGPTVHVKGKAKLDRQFATDHAAQLGDVVFDTLGATFDVSGEFTRGLDAAAGWTGAMDAAANGVVAPYVRANDVALHGAFREGALLLDPVSATINDGTVTATASIGLVGDKPPHSLTFDAKDVQLDGELAPLLAHASPLLALGESGRAGGAASAKGTLTTNGLKPQRLKRQMTGEGTLRLERLTVQSTNWIGQALQLVGVGSDLDVAQAEIPWTVKEGVVTTGNLPISAAGVDLRLGGTASLDGALDYTFGLKPKSGNSSFSKLASLLDKDGFLPLRLTGGISNPKMKLPDLKDIAKGALGGLLDRFTGKEEEKQDPEKDAKGGNKGKGDKSGKGDKDGTKKSATGDTPPPPPPPPGADPAKTDDPPPPPKTDDPPPPPTEDPPPPPEEDPPPPPPPPKEKQDDPPPPPPDDPPPPPK